MVPERSARIARVRSLATFGHKARDARDHDARRNRIGETAHGIDHDEARAGSSAPGRKRREFQVRDEFR